MNFNELQKLKTIHFPSKKVTLTHTLHHYDNRLLLECRNFVIIMIIASKHNNFSIPLNIIH